ncbi:MAG: hypothetical protein ABIF10_08050 [Candidatus Woesearchaeota archaeon]
MRESLGEAKEELKRADHLIYVSLKYTRSVDVIRSTIERLINTYEIIVKSVLVRAKERKLIASIPMSPGIQAEIVRDLYSDDETITNYIQFYLLLRRMYKGKYTRAREFRRNVTMTVEVDKKQVEVNIDIITEYYKRSLAFLDYVRDKFLK